MGQPPVIFPLTLHLLFPNALNFTEGGLESTRVRVTPAVAFLTPFVTNTCWRRRSEGVGAAVWGEA